MYKFIKSSMPADDSILTKIDAIEKKYNIIFPPVLKDYYCLYNNAKIKLCVFFVNGMEYEVAKIIPLISEKLNFEKIVNNDRKTGAVPEDLFPVARDRGGNYYYWRKDNSNVFYLPNDSIDEPCLITESLEKFFELLNNGII